MDRGHDRIPDRDQTVDPTVRRFAVPPLAQSLGTPGATADRHLHCWLLHRIASRSLTLLATTLARAGGMAPLIRCASHRTRRDGCDSGAVRAAAARSGQEHVTKLIGCALR